MSPQPVHDQGARSSLDQEDARLIDRFVEERRQAAGLPGVSIVVLEGGLPVHTRGYGLADVNADLPMTAETLVPIGSNTAGMTSLAALQLVTAGKLDLDAAVAEVLPWFTPSGDAGAPAMSLRRLLSHSAGMPARAPARAMEATEGPADDRTLEKLGRRVLAELEARRRDGHGDGDAPEPPVQGASAQAATGQGAPDGPSAAAGFEVSNDGYALAGLMIQEAAEAPFEVALQDHLFAPLGMHDARFIGLEAAPGQARGYRRTAGAVVPVPASNAQALAPAAGVMASARDLGRYLAALLTHRVPDVSEPLLRECWTPQVTIREGVSYGFGWFLTRSGELEVVAHPGEHEAGGSSFLLLPRLGTAVAVLTNLNSAAKDEIARGIVAILMGDEPAPSELRPQRAASSFEPDRGVWSAYTGDFEAPQGVLRVDVDGDTLRGTLLGQTFELEPHSDTEFVARSELPALDGASVAFKQEGDGRLVVLVQGRPFASR